jgi:hypothetical protein
MMSPASSICINWQSEPTILDGRTLASRIHDDRERHTNSAKTYHKDRDNRVWRRVECFLTTCSHFLARNHHCNGVSSHRRRKGQRWPVVIYDPHTHPTLQKKMQRWPVVIHDPTPPNAKREQIWPVVIYDPTPQNAKAAIRTASY